MVLYFCCCFQRQCTKVFMVVLDSQGSGIETEPLVAPGLWTELPGVAWCPQRFCAYFHCHEHPYSSQQLPSLEKASQNLCDSFQSPFTIGCSFELYTFSAATDSYFVLKKSRKKLIWPLCWGKQSSIFYCGAEKSFLLTLKLKVIDLNVE